jgi:hypothetical protein
MKQEEPPGNRWESPGFSRGEDVKKPKHHARIYQDPKQPGLAAYPKQSAAKVEAVALDKPWRSCHLCGLDVAAGSLAVWSPIRKSWRHQECTAPLP